jgi:hypothetical protein
MHPMMMVLAINHAIQQDHKTITLDGKPVICVDLGMTASLDDAEVTQVELDLVQLAGLFAQAASDTVLPAGTKLPGERKLAHDLPIRIERD